MAGITTSGDDLLVATSADTTLDGGGGRDGVDLARLSELGFGVDADLRAGLATWIDLAIVLVSIEDLYGGKSADKLAGDDRDNRLDGGDGPDRLLGRGGNDELLGGPGFDVADYTDTAEAVQADLVTGFAHVGVTTDRLSGIEHLVGGSGNDLLHGSAGADSLDGGPGNDLLEGGDGDDGLSGSAGRDTLNGGSGADRVSFDGARGAVVIDLEAGLADADWDATGPMQRSLLSQFEHAIGGAGADRLVGSSVANRLDGGLGADALTGADGNDTLDGGLGADRLAGGNGDDSLIGLGDGDSFEGGEGFDTLVIDDRSGSFGKWTVNLATGEFSGPSFSGRAAFKGVETIRLVELYSGKATTHFIGDDADNRLVAHTVSGGRGNDTLVGNWVDYSDTTEPIRLSLNGAPARAQIGASGTEVDDITVRLGLRLGSGNDVVSSVGGPAQLYGGAGDDWLVAPIVSGGAGDDTLDGGQVFYDEAPGPVFVTLGAASGGVVRGADGNDVLIGSPQVFGSRFADVMSAGAERVYFDAGAGDDTLRGGEGNDVLIGGAGNNLLRGGVGIDLLQADAGGASTLDGGDGNDNLQVSGAGHLLLGGDGDDRFFAEGGNTLDGGAGMDRLRIDQFVGPVTVNLLAGRIDGVGGETMQVSGIEVIEVLSASAVVQAARAGGAAAAGLTLLTGVASTTVFGSEGIDRVVFGQHASGQFNFLPAPAGGGGVGGLAGSSLTLTWPAQTAGAPNPVSRLRFDDVERLYFNDQWRAYGERALDVAEVAFALWSPAVAESSTLFGKGIHWYDNGSAGGRSRAELIHYALSWFADLSNAELATRLDANVASTHWSAADLLALMTARGGGADARAEVVALMTEDAANMSAVAATGFARDGIVCALVFAGESLFWPPG